MTPLPPSLRSAWPHPLRTAALAVGLAVLVVASAGCEKVRAERQRRAEQQAVAHAIEVYSSATESANAAHGEVLSAFGVANASTNLTDYKAALRTKVLPAMDAFIERLSKMPTGTPELGRIHGGLTEAYRRSRDAIGEFERGLQDPAGLPRFDAIRDTLQQDVRRYNEQLRDYYARQGRQLRSEAGAAKDAGGDRSTSAKGADKAAPASSPSAADAGAAAAPAPSAAVSAGAAASPSDGVPEAP